MTTRVRQLILPPEIQNSDLAEMSRKKNNGKKINPVNTSRGVERCFEKEKENLI